eukprot:GHVU01233237.1.p1 GENE.GHVU01233237.1~~GHVU01233237.1.p1  ORF type:complete len:100 (-),score=7.53 GHVU01233237.1:440-739(-)
MDAAQLLNRLALESLAVSRVGTRHPNISRGWSTAAKVSGAVKDRGDDLEASNAPRAFPRGSSLQPRPDGLSECPRWCSADTERRKRAQETKSGGCHCSS